MTQMDLPRLQILTLYFSSNSPSSPLSLKDFLEFLPSSRFYRSGNMWAKLCKQNNVLACSRVPSVWNSVHRRCWCGALEFLQSKTIQFKIVLHHFNDRPRSVRISAKAIAVLEMYKRREYLCRGVLMARTKKVGIQSFISYQNIFHWLVFYAKALTEILQTALFCMQLEQ